MILCVCHAVSDRVVKRVIADGACSLAAVREKTRAGSDCGTCRPAIHDLIEAHRRAERSPAPPLRNAS